MDSSLPTSPYPSRIVCLTEETTETLYLLGEGHRVVGVSGYTVRPPEARAKPKVFVYVNHPTSWLLRSDSDRMIFWWAEDYPLDEGYELAGVVENVSEKETVSLWGAEAAAYTPRSQNYLQVFRRPD